MAAWAVGPVEGRHRGGPHDRGDLQQEVQRAKRCCRRTEVPSWRIVTDDQWNAAHSRLQNAARVYLRSTNGRVWGRPPSDIESKYLLSGMLQCGATRPDGHVCDALMTVRNSSRNRQFYYVCAANDHRGKTVCGNSLRLPMVAADDAILTQIADVILDPEIVAGAVQDAVAELQPTRGSIDEKRAALKGEIERLGDRQARYVDAIGRAGDIAALTAALKDCERNRQRAQHELSALDGFERLSSVDVKRIEGDLVNRLTEWRALLKRQTPIARQMLSRIIDGRIVFTPHRDETVYEFAGRANFDRLLPGILLPQGVVPVRGFEPRSRG